VLVSLHVVLEVICEESSLPETKFLTLGVPPEKLPIRPDLRLKLESTDVEEGAEELLTSKWPDCSTIPEP
jgi:hypothetical protein